jgi:hypothetical protein
MPTVATTRGYGAGCSAALMDLRPVAHTAATQRQTLNDHPLALANRADGTQPSVT